MSASFHSGLQQSSHATSNIPSTRTNNDARLIPLPVWFRLDSGPHRESQLVVLRAARLQKYAERLQFRMPFEQVSSRFLGLCMRGQPQEALEDDEAILA